MCDKHAFEYDFIKKSNNIECCQVCKNEIKVVRNCVQAQILSLYPNYVFKASLENPETRDYAETSCDMPMDHYSQQVENCYLADCNEISQKGRCFNHKSCLNHLNSAEWIYCQECICSYCETVGCNIKDQSFNICSSCYNAMKCYNCYELGVKKFKDCQHYFCDAHNYSQYYCTCKKCISCGGDWVKIKSCFHEYSCECIFKGLCANCITKRNLEEQARRESEHNSLNTTEKDFDFAEEGKNKSIEEEKNSFGWETTREQQYYNKRPMPDRDKRLMEVNKVNICSKCNRNDSVILLKCKHYLCTLCYKFEKCSLCEKFCLECGNKPDSKKVCEIHEFCKSCASKNFCYICDESLFCNSCFSFNKSYPLLLCVHGKCKECLSKNKCLDCKECSVCKSTEKVKVAKCVHPKCSSCFIKPCSSCDLSPCDECGKKQAYKIHKKCSHRFCLEHTKNICTICERCSSCSKSCDKRTLCPHKFCMDCFNNCKKCICAKCQRNKPDKVEKCGHAYCNGCYENYCKICMGNCELCGELLEFAKGLKCQHKLCRKCFVSECPLCNIDRFCKGCRNLYSPFSTIKICNHQICIACIKVGKCRFCVCNKCNEFKNLSMQDNCKHLRCIRCNTKNCNECRSIECGVCGLMDSNKIILNCGHKACEKCFVQNKCFNCEENPYCKVCHNKVEKNKLCQHNTCVGCSQQKRCDCFCMNCITLNQSKCIDCGSYICATCNSVEKCNSCLLKPSSS